MSPGELRMAPGSGAAFQEPETLAHQMGAGVASLPYESHSVSSVSATHSGHGPGRVGVPAAVENGPDGRNRTASGGTERLTRSPIWRSNLLLMAETAAENEDQRTSLTETSFFSAPLS